MSARIDVQVRGFGLMGRLLCWRLKQAGLRVAWTDPHPQQAAAHVPPAMLAPLAEAVHSGEALYRMGLDALPLWQAWLAELGDIQHGFDGTLVLSHAQDQGLMREFEQRLPAGGARPCQAAELEPALAGRFGRGLWLAGEGYLDNGALMNRLAELAAEDQGEREAPIQVDCTGAGAPLPGLRAVRGEVARLHAPEVKLSRPVRLLHPRYPLYIVPRPKGQFVVGATQLETDDRSPVSVQSALELLSAAHSLHPAFAEARIEALQVGLRPAFADNQPRLDWRGRQLSINGLYRHGFMVGPVIAERAVQEIVARLGGVHGH
ncbi:FAD-dependent oxidoreductase [Gallaecimonas kandeliae]|uniref:FAD-dependent oxidoreductase n=1 Tax=Gallaecimonas kandeliae TaxID=3029055 RepID=UPI002649337F|nr:FAD-dependent oxidoreductase [Gallaecimonas kandeliae]WKE65716.1 FAD-dependent oxidoreductase [Gallaecimonas kandeliae]